jgi:hypothetical protein
MLRRINYDKFDDESCCASLAAAPPTQGWASVMVNYQILCPVHN